MTLRDTLSFFLTKSPPFLRVCHLKLDRADGRQAFHDTGKLFVHFVDNAIGKSDEARLILGDSLESGFMFWAVPQKLEQCRNLDSMVIPFIKASALYFSIQEEK